MKQYVTGFLFTDDARQVVLIKKINPQWQQGLYNGIGGKIESGEVAVEAMVREFREETGVSIARELWTHYAQIYRPAEYDLGLFLAYSDKAFQVTSADKELVQLFNVDQLPNNLIPNLRWLIPLALDREIVFNQPVQLLERAEPRIKA